MSAASLEVMPGLWLGIWQPGGLTPLRGSERRRADRAAAGKALACAFAAAPRSERQAAHSVSHSEGVGAALVGPRGRRLGVDVVRVGRLSRRHAESVLDSSEWQALGTWPRIRPALGWALKEAAAKATREAETCFPDGLRLASGVPSGLEVRSVSDPMRVFIGGWLERGPYLFAWAVEPCRPW